MSVNFLELCVSSERIPWLPKLIFRTNIKSTFQWIKRHVIWMFLQRVMAILLEAAQASKQPASNDEIGESLVLSYSLMISNYTRSFHGFRRLPFHILDGFKSIQFRRLKIWKFEVNSD